VPLNIIQRQHGHASLGTTSIYLQGIDPEEIITAVRTRRAPMMSASAGLRLRKKRGSGGVSVRFRSALPKRAPGWPTVRRSSLVRSEHLSRVARDGRIQRYRVIRGHDDLAAECPRRAA
jgi:hypothetical protein